MCKLEEIKVGRPSLGKGKVVKITLPEEEWELIERQIASGLYDSYSEYFRILHMEG